MHREGSGVDMWDLFSSETISNERSTSLISHGLLESVS